MVFDSEIGKLERAIEILGEVESSYENTGAQFLLSRDRNILESAFHSATHEAATVIGLSLEDIKTLIERLRIRAAYSVFTEEQFDFIVQNPWSTTKVSDLLEAVGNDSVFTLATLSPVVKQIQQEWNALRRLSGSYGYPAE